MSQIFTPNKTSAELLVDYVAKTWRDHPDQQLQWRFLLVYDLFIKARSYAILNKLFFCLALLAGVLVLAWPSIAVIFAPLKFEGLVEPAVLQTSITGLAALLFAAYSHYKKRQMHAENLMRYVIFSHDTTDVVIEKILKEMERIDAGFVFSESISPKIAGSDQTVK